MRILGIDPGSIVCGYGVIEKEGKHISLIEYGVIEAKKREESLPLRLKVIYERLESVIDRSLPDMLAIESVFYHKNVASVVKLAHARAAAILAAVNRELPTVEYSPKEVKRSVTGNGNASKEQVQYMIKQILKIEETPEFYDATDALAVCLCHLYRISAVTPGTRRAKNWSDFIQHNPTRVKS
jgi:crossover junction endodeoxyribonuclease RuvC